MSVAEPLRLSCTRRPVLILTVVAALITLVPASAQQGKGVVEGKLVNRTDPAKVPAKVEIDVVGLGGGMSILKSTTTDASGRFRADGLPTDSPMLIRANYKSVNYHARVSFDGSGKAQAEVEVYEPTASRRGITLESLQIAFQLAGDQLQSIESYSFRNDTNPPQTYMNPDGNFRFSKPPQLLEPPRIEVTAPGSEMPLTQSALESPDGQSYYSLFPVRPGVTTFQVVLSLPYKDKSYTLRRKFYEDIASFQIGVRPRDIKVTGDGLAGFKTDARQDIAVYSGGPVKAGTEAVWTFAGGTAAPMASESEASPAGESRVQPVQTTVGRNAIIIGPLILLGLILTLWYAFSRIPETAVRASDSRNRELRERREQLLRYLANLDARFEAESLERREYVRQRELGKRQLRRIALLLHK